MIIKRYPFPALEMEAESSLSSGEFLVIEPTKRRTKQRRVSFNDNVIVWSRKNPPLDPEEITAGWLQIEETRNIRSRINDTLCLMRSGTKIDETTHCTRGIEHLVDIKANRRARRLVVNSVLTEQDLQRYEGINDMELVAHASCEFSTEHREQGHLRGLYDQQEKVKSFPRILAQENRLMQLKRKSAITPLIRCQ
jgi:hypothetical protein